ncbi:MAG: amino acid dehydrogenase [Candidatus Midichloriaceae bacterium]|jgi:D-amino-acid dehydrogenase|nr:amino acid dehydrogenase [Candidatus Midichloriaceae bacterium]
MQVAVLGAGVIGVSTAYFLAKAGAKVLVFERESQAGMQCSYANGAQLSYSHADPWATYGNVIKAIKWLGQNNAPLLLRPRVDPDMYIWIMKFLRNCSQIKVDKNTQAILNLGFYSKKVLHELMQEEKIDFEYSTSGILHIFKHAKELDQCQKLFDKFRNMKKEVEFSRLSKSDCMHFDNSLEHLMKGRIGGVLCSADEIGDAFKFTQELVKITERMGVQYNYDTEVLGLRKNKAAVTSIILDDKQIEVDAVIVCLGAYGNLFLRRHDINLPIYPMKGYSISIPTDSTSICPKVSVTDQQRKVVFSHIGNTFRVAGTAEFAGYNHEILDERIAPIVATSKKYFPKGGDYSRYTAWACLRPQTPHSYPYISNTIFKNLYVNIGHGSLGWTQALGSAKAIADLTLKKSPELNLNPYIINN